MKLKRKNNPEARPFSYKTADIQKKKRSFYTITIKNTDIYYTQLISQELLVSMRLLPQI